MRVSPLHGLAVRFDGADVDPTGTAVAASRHQPAAPSLLRNDLHVKTMYVCILDAAGQVLVHRNMSSAIDAWPQIRHSLGFPEMHQGLQDGVVPGEVPYGDDIQAGRALLAPVRVAQLASNRLKLRERDVATPVAVQRKLQLPIRADPRKTEDEQ